ncbi:peptidyl-prolyl cis-trans isomerase [Methylopila jiangsuensis]|uniref:Peptidyl-prolyl cis-trans isomerase n=1 Tax=Methylopila jiangsuensis TaxID=586230 RepID=A0A9W6JG03_9HYPH|nr:peptidylprolyl isomerase [Methylopila jiangsuensis]MDR6285427.1 peptidylprolyl isomerase [Methylopila jiangsuensis]GLK75185.1 peptidyl-prolyl cis-trans isomerase [Methylopila jiangsuensis]
MKLPLAFAVALGFGGPAVAQTAPASAPTVVLETTKGPVAIRLRPDLAPKHVERIVRLTNEKFYDGVLFHRVIAGFMAQTGDPTGTGTGGSKYPDLPAEFSKESFKRGAVGMARAGSPDSANSQFFISYAPAPWLDGQYTIVGEVTSGMENVDKLAKGVGPGGMAPNPDKVTTMRVQGAR